MNVLNIYMWSIKMYDEQWIKETSSLKNFWNMQKNWSGDLIYFRIFKISHETLKK